MHAWEYSSSVVIVVIVTIAMAVMTTGRGVAIAAIEIVTGVADLGLIGIVAMTVETMRPSIRGSLAVGAKMALIALRRHRMALGAIERTLAMTL